MQMVFPVWHSRQIKIFHSIKFHLVKEKVVLFFACVCFCLCTAHLRKEENRFLQSYLWTLELLYNTITNKPQVNTTGVGTLLYTTGAGENVIEGYDDS